MREQEERELVKEMASGNRSSDIELEKRVCYS
jgi:hypothetical protein